MIIIAILALLLRVIIERVIKRNIVQNESSASVTLKLISTALEKYSEDQEGAYPADFSLLTKSEPPYLDKDYIQFSPIKGYHYSCPRLEPAGYSCYATPTRCNLTAKLVYSISTGGLLVSEECKRKE